MSRHAAPRRRSGRVRAVLSLGIVLGLGTTGTLASWTDNAVMTTGGFTAGSMDLKLNDTNASGQLTGYANTSLTWSALSPGEAKAFSLKVNNIGNPPFTYTATATKGSSWGFSDNPLTVQIYTGTVTAVTTYPQVDTCSGSSLGTVQTVDATNKALLTAAQRVSANSSQTLCVVVGLAATAANSDQGQSATLSFTFAATQAMS